MTTGNTLLRNCPVAIIGMASVFADAENIKDYWENIIRGTDSIKAVPENRWKISDYYSTDPHAADKTYCKVGGFIPEIDFNPMEFGFPPNLMEATDTAQLLSLVVARDALMDAGYAPGSVKFDAALRERTGVILGVGGGQNLILPLSSRLESPVWRKAMESAGLPEQQIAEIIEKIKAAYIPWSEDAFPGLLGNVVAGRITNRFDLGGINSVVDAACASSLSAVKMALSELIEGRCDLMITGGVDTNNSPFMYMNFSKTPAFSPSGNIRPFDEASDGMLIGEGLGMIICKRLEDAIRDGDRIYATINGIGSSSDGRFKSIYAPRPHGQALAMERTYEEAGYDASTVGLIEAHGTGTVAGDLSEVTSTKAVFGKSNFSVGHIAIGSVKSQIGHTKAAAGIAGLIKAALALHHKILPATLNVDKPNPTLGIDKSALYVNTKTRPWFRKTAHMPRRAAVSAFGFGGVNLHTTLEEFNKEHHSPYRQHTLHDLVLLHAVNPESLLESCQAHLHELNETEGHKYLRKLARDVSSDKIPAANCRVGFVVSSVEEARLKLEKTIQVLGANIGKHEWEQPLEGIWYRHAALDKSYKTVAMFAGQGSQYANMGAELACNYPAVRNAFEQANRFFEAKNQSPLTDTVFPIPVFSVEDAVKQEDELRKTQFAQPAIGALSAGMFRILADAGFKADLFAGHSYGELTALWAAGVLDDNAFYGLSKIRGEAMAASPTGDSGKMLAIKGPRSVIDQLLKSHTDLWISNINSPSQIIIGGKTEALLKFQEQTKVNDLVTSMLPVSAAFHTPLVAHAHKPFAQAVGNIHIGTPTGPVFSNTTGKPYPDRTDLVKQNLSDHILKPVRFQEQIENMYDMGGRVFVEFGPKNILSNLVKEILTDKDFRVITLNGNAKKDSDRQFREGITQLIVLGFDLAGFDSFQQPVQEPAEKSKLNIKISGHNYVSQATKQKYETLYANSREVSPEPVSYEPLSQPEEEIMNESILKMQADIAILMEQQKRIEALLQSLIQLQSVPKTNGTPSPAILLPKNEIDLSLVNSHSNGHTNGYSNGHHNGSENGFKNAGILAEDIQEVPLTDTSVNLKVIEESLLNVVAEKTGYPVEMLETTMDMEADLGIDSIKRVEIFGTMTEAHPSVQGVKPQELAELRTLQQIVDYLVNKMAGNTLPGVPVNRAVYISEPTPAPILTPEVPEAQVNFSLIENSLLEVVAEKTGYPVEMLELSMDMEADLGIDSIKRVEIFGTMTEAHPSVQGIKPQELAELRTLRQIVDYLVTKMQTVREVAEGKKY